MVNWGRARLAMGQRDVCLPPLDAVVMGLVVSTAYQRQACSRATFLFGDRDNLDQYGGGEPRQPSDSVCAMSEEQVRSCADCGDQHREGMGGTLAVQSKLCACRP
jgi:hypothetical protein